jgi:hypothetical protein
VSELLTAGLLQQVEEEVLFYYLATSWEDPKVIRADMSSKDVGKQEFTTSILARHTELYRRCYQ